MKNLMKKAILILMVAALTAGLALTAFAEDGESETAGSVEGSFTITKTYKSTDGKTFPKETLTFTVTPDSANPDGAEIKVGSKEKNEYEVTAITSQIPVYYPSFSKMGVYKYTITENQGNSQGVTYATNEIKVAILVDNELNVTAGVEKTEPDAAKADSFENTYKLGGEPGGPDPDNPDPNGGNDSLSVKKTVTGNLGNKEKLFTIKVTLTAESGKTVNSDITVSGGSDPGNNQTVPAPWTGSKEVTIQLKNDETVKLSKIPDGVSYTVEEDQKHLVEADAVLTPEQLNGDEAYKVTYQNEEGKIAAGTKPEAAVTNDKGTTVNTGISLDSLPYLLILAAVAVGAVVIFRRRRVED